MLLSGPRACKKAAVEEVEDMTLNFFPHCVYMAAGIQYIRLILERISYKREKGFPGEFI